MNFCNDGMQHGDIRNVVKFRVHSFSKCIPLLFSSVADRGNFFWFFPRRSLLGKIVVLIFTRK